jgi:uncharacterized membrane protein
MNRLLADTLAVLNGLLAIGIVVAGVVAGYTSLYPSGNHVFGAIMGGLLGFTVAGAFCGLIAFLVLIESHLRRMAEAGGTLGRTASGRSEPQL